MSFSRYEVYCVDSNDDIYVIFLWKSKCIQLKIPMLSHQLDIVQSAFTGIFQAWENTVRRSHDAHAYAIFIFLNAPNFTHCFATDWLKWRNYFWTLPDTTFYKLYLSDVQRSTGLCASLLRSFYGSNRTNHWLPYSTFERQRLARVSIYFRRMLHFQPQEARSNEAGDAVRVRCSLSL